MNSGQEKVGSISLARPTWSAHVEILRVDHWFKNVFVLPGIVIPLSLDFSLATSTLPLRIVIGLFSICLIASSNYVLNEILDAPFDRLHPTKCRRPVPSGRVFIPGAYAQWLALMLLGLGLAFAISDAFVISMAVFWLLGCAYNMPPIRLKDTPYVDVLTESLNNPLRMLAGWTIVGAAVTPPISLLMSYWMVGCYFMAMKRFAEYRTLRSVFQWTYVGNQSLRRAADYRKSFGLYTEARLLISTVFYASAAMLFFGAFLMRYRLELVLAFPFVALVLAAYQALAFREESPVQRPEELYKEPIILIPVIVCAVVMTLLLFLDLPTFTRYFARP